MQGLASKVIDGAKWSAIGMWGRRAIGFVVFAIIARNVAPESLGLVALTTVYGAFIEMFTKQGLGMAIVQAKTLDEQQTRTAFTINVVTALILSALSFLLADPIATLLGDPRLAPVLRVLAFAYPINASIIVPVSLQTREFQFKAIAQQSFIATIASSLVAIPMALYGLEVWALVAQIITFSVANCITIWIQVDWKPRFAFDKSCAKTLLGFSVKVLASNIAAFARTRSDQIFIGISAGPVGLGLYTLGKRVSEIVDSFISGPIDRVATSAFARLQDDKPRLLKAVSRSTAINAALTFPTFIGIALVSREAIILAFTDKWSEATTACAYLSLAILAKCAFFFIYHIFMSQGRPGALIWIQLVHAIGVIVAAVIGKHWGVDGIALGIFISGLVLNALTTLYMGKSIGFATGPIFAAMSVPLLASSAMAGAILAARHWIIDPYITSALVSASILIPLGGIVYLAFLRLFAPNLLKELIEIGKKLKKGKKQQPAPDTP